MDCLLVFGSFQCFDTVGRVKMTSSQMSQLKPRSTVPLTSLVFFENEWNNEIEVDQPVQVYLQQNGVSYWSWILLALSAAVHEIVKMEHGVCVMINAVTYYTLDSVLTAFALTCIVTCALTVYAMKTKKDFTVWGAGYVLSLY